MNLLYALFYISGTRDSNLSLTKNTLYPILRVKYKDSVISVLSSRAFRTVTMHGIFLFMTPCSLVPDNQNTRPHNSKDQNMIVINYLFHCHIFNVTREKAHTSNTAIGLCLITWPTVLPQLAWALVSCSIYCVHIHAAIQNRVQGDKVALEASFASSTSVCTRQYLSTSALCSFIYHRSRV
jgi:hypothetical protein